MQEQSNEGCNVAGRIRINKVVGIINLSPGRSFQTSSPQQLYELVPYLRDDGNRHDFSHTIHQFAFESDDEYETHKYDAVMELRQRLNLIYNPLDGAEAKVNSSFISSALANSCTPQLDQQSSLYVSVFPQSGVDAIPCPWTITSCKFQTICL